MASSPDVDGAVLDKHAGDLSVSYRRDPGCLRSRYQTYMARRSQKLRQIEELSRGDLSRRKKRQDLQFGCVASQPGRFAQRRMKTTENAAIYSQLWGDHKLSQDTDSRKASFWAACAHRCQR